MATLLATQLVETKPRLLVDGHVVGEPSAFGSADYVHMYTHALRVEGMYVSMYVGLGQDTPLSGLEAAWTFNTCGLGLWHGCPWTFVAWPDPTW